MNELRSAVLMFGRARVGEYLLSLLTAATVHRYGVAVDRFDGWCRERSLDWEALNEEEQDFYVADFVLDLMDDEESIRVGRDAISGLQRRWPRRRYTVAWQVTRGWSQQTPPERAPPMPQEVAMTLVVLFTAAGKDECALATLLCFAAFFELERL